MTIIRRSAGGPGTETQSFGFADRRIGQLLGKLAATGTCGCCCARALGFHGAALMEETIGTAATIEELEAIVAALRNNPTPVPERGVPLH